MNIILDSVQHILYCTQLHIIWLIQIIWHVHSDKIIPILKTMQNERHFEIGWHNDLVTLQVIYNINPVTFLA